MRRTHRRNHAPPNSARADITPAFPGSLWDVQKCAEFLCKTKNAIYLMVNRRSIPFIKIGSSVRFDPREIEAWLQQFRVDPETDHYWR